MEKQKEFKDIDDFMLYLKSLSLKQVILDMGYVLEEDFKGSKICCPFHDEKTPSCQVTDDFFKCYGCNAKGDLIKFIQMKDSLSFTEAIQKLAEFFNVVILNNHIGEFSKMKGELRDKWNQYKDDLQELLRTGDKGLIEWIDNQVKSFFPLECGYDKYTKYLCLPFTNKQGQILGFTKRRVDYPTINKNNAKWIHSTTTNSLIKECSNVFNLVNANKEMLDTKTAYLVEGPRDVAAMVRDGFLNTIAVCGSHNFNEKVINVIMPIEHLVLTMDGDDAGLSGTFDVIKFLSKAYPNLLMNSYVIEIPDNLDPSDYLDKNGKDSLKGLDKNKISCIKWLLKYKTKDEYIEFLNSIESNILRDSMITSFMKKYGLTYSYTKEMMDQSKRSYKRKENQEVSYKDRLLATIGKGSIDVEPIPGMSEEEAKRILKIRFGICEGGK